MTSRSVELPRCANTSQHLHLTINADVSVGGNLTFALLDAESGVALPGFSHDDCVAVVGNRLGALLRYRRDGNVANATSDLGPATMRPVKLDLRLRPPVRIYAWRFECV